MALMPKPKSDKDDPIDDGMFDFLGEDAANRPARKNKQGSSEESAAERSARAFDEQHPRVREPKALPIIRKPVPVSESGPNKNPNDTAGPERGGRQKMASTADFDDDFGFLDNGQRKPEQNPKNAQAAGSAQGATGGDFGENWNEGLHDYNDDEDVRPRRTTLWLALAGVVVLGVGSFALERMGLFDSDTSVASSPSNEPTPTTMPLRCLLPVVPAHLPELQWRTNFAVHCRVLKPWLRLANSTQQRRSLIP